MNLTENTEIEIIDVIAQRIDDARYILDVRIKMLCIDVSVPQETKCTNSRFFKQRMSNHVNYLKHRTKVITRV